MMRHLLLLFVLLSALSPSPVGSAPAALEDRVKALVLQLGDDDFQKREAASVALLKLGEAVLSVIEKLGPQMDLEVVERLRRLRHALVGYLDDIRTFLNAAVEITDESKHAIPDELRRVIAGSQPRSGDFLLTLVADPKAALHRRAINAFVHTWDTMSAPQLERYLRLILVLEARPRGCYPQGIEAAIAMLYSPRHGWGDWPSGDAFPFATRTTHFLDGKPYGSTFSYQGPMATTGWIQTKDLALGKHTCRVELEYEYTHKGEKHTGRLRSSEFAFTMVGADTPDDLVAPVDDAVTLQVNKALRFGQKLSDFNAEALRPGLFRQPGEEERRPQITWEAPKGKRSGLAMVLWNVDTPLPIDLCFEVALHDQKTGKVYPCDPLILRRGQAHGGYVCPRDAVGFARGRSGEVAVKVVLTPSRKMALSTTDVSRYYPGTVTSSVLSVKVFNGDADAPQGIRNLP